MSSYYIKLPFEAGGGGAVDSVNGQTGVVVITKSDVGLSNVDNTSDANKPVSTATQTALNGKAALAHTHPLSDLTQSGAITGQIPIWNGSSWAAGTSPAGVTDHLLLSNIGTNTHADIDTHIADTSNPHSVTKSQVGLSDVDNTSDLDKPISDDTQDALDLKQDIVAASPETMAYYNGSGVLSYTPQLTIDAITLGLRQNITTDPSAAHTYKTINASSTNVVSTITAPSSYTVVNYDVLSANTASGLSNGALVMREESIHVSSGDVSGELSGVRQFINMNGSSASVVNGSVTFNQMGGTIGPFANIQQGVTGSIFNLQVQSGAYIQQNVVGFQNNPNIQIPLRGGVGFQDSANITELDTNVSYRGFSVNSNITLIPATSNAQGVSINPNIGTIEADAYFQGLWVMPNVTLNKSYAPCIQVSNQNITNYAGVSASLVVQDITYTHISPGTEGNNVTIEYVSDVTSGSEYAELTGSDILVHIESGVTDATAVAATFPALDIADVISVVITGTASNAQVTAAQTNLAGGENPGNSPAAQFTGDVNIDGSLSFTGGLSIGALDSFANKEFVDAASDVDVVQRLFTRLYTQPSTAYAGVDAIGVGTVSIIELADNSSVANGSIGVAALGLPAVLSLGTASTIDKVNGAVFVLALEGTGTGGTADVVNLCNAFAIPDGLTTVNNLYGYKMELPGGNPATNTWGLYIEPAINNHMSGSLTIGTVDQPTNSDVALEITNLKAMRLSNLTTAQRNALVALPGMVIFNTDTLAMEYYNGTAWV